MEHTEAVRKLIQAGASFNLQDVDGKTTLDYALVSKLNNAEIVGILKSVEVW